MSVFQVFSCCFPYFRSDSFILHISPKWNTANTITAPSTAPAMISVGKCTYRYSLVNAISAASGNATYPIKRFVFHKLTAPIKLCSVCPDGNE